MNDAPALPVAALKLPPERNFGGEWILIGDVQMLVPPLSFLRMQEVLALVDKIQEAGAGATAREHMRSITDINFFAISRNYPSMTRDEVAEKLDVKNAMEVTEQVLEVSGIRRLTPGEAQSP